MRRKNRIQRVIIKQNVLPRPKVEGKIMTIARKIEENPLVRLLAVLSLFLAVISFWNEAAERKEQRIARAWETLTRKVVGNTGKEQALQYLAKNGVSLSGLDLSCQTMSNLETDATCTTLTGLGSLNLNAKVKAITDSNFSGTRFNGANIQNVEFIKVHFKGARFRTSTLNYSKYFLVNFSKSWFFNTDFKNVEFIGVKFENSIISHSNFYGSNLAKTNFRYAKVIGVDFSNSNLSGSTFKLATFNSTVDIYAPEYGGKNFAKPNNFSNANLTNVNFSSVEKLSTAIFDGSYYFSYHTPHDNKLVSNGKPRILEDTILKKVTECKVIDTVVQKVLVNGYNVCPNIAPKL